MVAITNSTSLTFIKEEIDSALSQAEASLEAFSEDPSQKEKMQATADAFSQIRGVCFVLELHGAAMLAQEMANTTEELLEHADPKDQTSALSSAIVLLSRYLEYVQIKNRSMPALLISGINELRRAANKPPIQESHFFSVDLSRDRYPGLEPAGMEPAEIAKVVRRLRHMYQIGLLSVVKEDNPPMGLKLMARALKRIDPLCGGVSFSRLIWVARAVVEAMLKDAMAITPARKMLLSQFDRQLKSLVYDAGKALHTDPPLLLIKEGAYVVSLSQSHDGVIGEVKEVFDLRAGISDRELQTEIALMSGGSGSVMRTVAVGLREELAELKQNLEWAAQGVADMSFREVGDQMTKVAGTMVMIGLAKESQALKERATEVSAWQADEVNPEGQAFQQLVDELLAVENAVAGLEREFAPADDVRKEAVNSKISLYQLDDARMAVVGECRSSLSLAKRAITSFMESDWNKMHLNNLPSSLNGLVGGLTFLELDRARAVMESCTAYIEQALIGGAVTPDAEQMETLADAVTSVDYYLESMEENKPIGDGVLEVAEESLGELGYPVVRANTL